MKLNYARIAHKTNRLLWKLKQGATISEIEGYKWEKNFLEKILEKSSQQFENNNS